jgi:hypothetical protein
MPKKRGASETVVRERQREIQWLERELATVPLIKRRAEARDAWRLNEQAASADDPRTKFDWLKEARKSCPKR